MRKHFAFSTAVHGKLQQSSEHRLVCVSSPARIPLECWEAPTKGLFTGGPGEEEPVQVMDRGEKGTFTVKRESETLLCINSCLG